MRAHGERIQQLHLSGVLLTGGHTTGTDNPSGLLVVSAQDETAARAIADADPAVRAGMLKALVQPFDLVIAPPAPSALTADAKANYDVVSRYVLEAARKMPEAEYAFSPTAGVRTFGQLLGHIAEAQYIGCGAVRGDAYTPHRFEETKTGKAELIGVLETAFGYCQEAWAKAGTAAGDRVTPFGQQRTKMGALEIGTAHVFEHYGNLVTYMRLRGLVPPSSEKAATASSER